MFKNQNSANVVTVAESNKSIKRAQNQFDFQFITTAKKPQAKKRSVDAKTKHAIYDRLITMLEGKPAAPSLVLHGKAKFALQALHGMTKSEIAELESSIVEALPVRRDRSTIPQELYRALGKTGETAKIFEKRIVCVPDEDLNLLVCEKLLKDFSINVLLACPGFIMKNSMLLMLDVGPHLFKRGFIIPHADKGLIVELEVYRNIEDGSPFKLKSKNTEGR